MATSGRIETRRSQYGSFFYFQWQLTGQNIGGNFSSINWQWGINSGNGVWYSNAVKSIAGYINGGQAFGGATWSNISGNYDRTLLSGSWNIGHNGDGTKVFGMSSSGTLYQSGQFDNSGQWELPRIPRHAVLTALSMDAGGITAYDEGPMWLEFSNPAGTAVDAFIDDPLGRAYTSGAMYEGGRRFDFPFSQGLINRLQQSSPNSNAFNINIGIHDNLGGDSYDYRTRTVYIKNDQGQANPVFSNFVFYDSNPQTVAITGNDQYAIQGNSFVEGKVLAADKATPRKYANMSAYRATLGNYSNDWNYASSGDASLYFGSATDITGTKDIRVAAIDSRGNSTTVTKQITVLPYKVPEITATLSRANGYDDAVLLKINGVISPLTIGSSDKNAVNAATGIQYRMAMNGADISTQPWINVPSTQTAGTGAVAANNQGIIIAAQGAASANNNYEIQARIIDKMYTTTTSAAVNAGVSIFRIGLDKKVYNNEKQLMTLPTLTNVADGVAAAQGGSTGVRTPWSSSVSSIYTNGGVVVFDVVFSCMISTPMRGNWRIKIDGNTIGNANRSIVHNVANSHFSVGGTVVARGLSAGSHTLSLELQGDGSNSVSTDTNDHLHILATEYPAAYSPTTTGPNYAGAVTNGFVDQYPWSDTQNAIGAPDSNSAYTAATGRGSSQIVTSQHGFNIPASAIITGIKLETSVAGYPGAHDDVILIGNSSKMSPFGSTPNYGQSWGTSQGTRTYGGPGQLWGQTWTASDINSPSFGATVSGALNSGFENIYFYGAGITVYYI